MKPVAEIMPGQDLPVTTFAKDQPEYLQLPAYKFRDGTITTRWRLSWRERLRMFLTGNLWLTVKTFNYPLQPVRLDTECPLKFQEGAGDS